MIKKMIKKILAKLFKGLVVRQGVKYIDPLKVNWYSSMTSKTNLGFNTNFNGIKITGCGSVNIGNNFHSGSECLIITQNHNYEGEKIPYDSTYICKDVTIENNVWIGNRVIILGGVTIGEGAIIQAGSVVIKDIARHAIAGGNPAKVFMTRDVKHYEKLKKDRKFH